MLDLRKLARLAIVLSVTTLTGCGMTVTFGTDSVCKEPFGIYQYSRHDTPKTRADLAAKNKAMRAIGCPELTSPGQ